MPAEEQLNSRNSRLQSGCGNSRTKFIPFPFFGPFNLPISIPLVEAHLFPFLRGGSPMTQRQPTPTGSVRLPPYPSVTRVLTLLIQAYRDAKDNGQMTWEYAVELNWFQNAGVAGSTLRSLMDK